MPPEAGAKRKRGDRAYSGDDGSRPSPYRPGSSGFAQNQGYGGGGPAGGGGHHHHNNHGHHPQQQHQQQQQYYGSPDDRGGRGRGRGRTRAARGSGGGAGRGGQGAGGRGGGASGVDHANGPYQHGGRSGYGRQASSAHSQAQGSTQALQTTSRPGNSLQSSQQQTQSAAQGDGEAATAEKQQLPREAEPAAPPPVRIIEINENFDDSDIQPVPYSYERITDELINSWEEKGREAVLADATALIRGQDDLSLNVFFLEILRSALDGRVHPSEAGRLIKAILAVEAQDEERMDADLDLSPTSAFLDVVSMLSDSDKKSRRLAVLLYRSEVSPDTMREELDSDLLINLNLVRPVFSKAFIRHQTNVLYRQSNYNLLREETEGYSKLLTELFTTSENASPSAEIVKATFERVRSMIGTFDLDVGRTLDVTLDVFAAVIVKHHRFMVKFLRDSSWWPQRSPGNAGTTTLPYWALPDSDGFDTGADEQLDELRLQREARDIEFWKFAQELDAKSKGILAWYRLRGLHLNLAEPSTEATNEEDKKWQEVTGTDPPSGNKVAAQILGFKLRYYSSRARDAQDELPIGLIHLTALLVKLGFISLRDVYAHLWPEDDAMETVRKAKEEEKREVERAAMPGAGAVNALQAAGALSDDTLPSGLSKEPEKAVQAAERGTVQDSEADQDAEQLPEPRETKVELLKALLCVGAIPDALYMIGRFPWMLESVTDLPEYIHRLAHHSLSKLYDPIKPLQHMPELQKQAKIIDPDQSGVARGDLRRIDKIEKKSLRSLHLEQFREEEGIFYRYYWDDWNDNVPVCQTTDDLFVLCDTLLSLTGVKIGQDSLLLAKLIRIGAASLKTDPSEENTKRWVNLCKKLLVPALSLTRRNPGIMNEMYHHILKHLPIATRYSIYAEWYLGPTSRLPAMVTAFNLCRAETKGLLRRVSRNNIKQCVRPLAKISTASPGITFDVAIYQIESYPILIECFVECARYLTDLGYDVLTWSTLSALARKGRDTTSADGLFTSKWLQHLSTFCGRIFWRYKMLDADPVIYYLDNQLAKGKPDDLKILEEMIRSMAGISELTYTDSHILALAGGRLLQALTLQAMFDRRHESRLTAERLRAALVRTKTLGSFIIALAQETQVRMHKMAETGAPLKLQGSVQDEMYRIFFQYFEFLKAWVSTEQFQRWVPSTADLINKYGIEPRNAFAINRHVIKLQMEDYKSSKSTAAAQPIMAELDVEMDAEVDATQTQNDESAGATSGGENDLNKESTEGSVKIPWNPVLKDIVDKTRERIGESTLSVIGELFYMTFWQLALDDMLVPTASYEEEIARQKEKIREIDRDRSDLSAAGSHRRNESRLALNRLQEDLRGELREQIASYSSFTRIRMSREKEFWFAQTWGKHDALNTALLEHCFIPRMALSPLDAYYCFKMLKMLHSTGTKNFRTMGFLDQFFNQKRLTVLFYMCTTREAENIARFIHEVLKDLSKWHVSRAVYEKEACGSKSDLPGFCLRIGNDKSQYQFLGFGEFRRLLFKWHGQLANALRHCLESKEYMHIRNAITILHGIVDIFPAVDMQAKKLNEAVILLSKSDPREDVKLAAFSLVNIFKKRDQNDDFIPHTSFHQLTKDGHPVPLRPASTTARGARRLNAEATSFKPLIAGLGKPEPEDGEISSPVVTDAPKQGVNGAKPASSSNLSQKVEGNATPKANVSKDTGGEENISKGAPRKESRPPGRSSPAPGTQYGRDTERLANGRLNSSRPPHALPQRPEASGISSRRSERLPPVRTEERGNRDIRPSRDSRDLAQQETTRGGRPLDGPAPRPPDRLANDRGHERTPERLPHAERDKDMIRRPDITSGRQPSFNEPPDRSERGERSDRTSRQLPRDDRPTRELRGRHGYDSDREAQARERPSGEGGMLPPASGINPERARLLQGAFANNREDAEPSGRHSYSRPGSDRGSRAASPVRKDERDYPPSSRLDRPPPTDGPRPRDEERRLGRSRAEKEPFIGHDDRSRMASAGSDLGEPRASRSRDYRPPPGESQYGRLNGPEPTPSGPRGANGNQSSSKHSRLGLESGSQIPPPERPTPMDRQAPTGPASSRHRRGSSSAFGKPSSSSTPSTPGPADAPTASVHPERAARLRLNTRASGGPDSPAEAPRGPSSGGHGNHGRSGLSSAQTGPPSPADDRGRDDKRAAAMINAIQQSNGPLNRNEQGTSIRGRGSRNPPQSPSGPGPSPSGGSVRREGPPHADSPRGRGDLFGDGGSGSTRGPPRDAAEARTSRRLQREPSPPPGRAQPAPGGPPPEEMRPMPGRRESRELRARGEPHSSHGPADRDLRHSHGEPYGSHKEYPKSRERDRRSDVRDVAWDGEGRPQRSEGRPPGGPSPFPRDRGSGRKRRSDYEDSGEPKRSRRGG